jgi:hydroxymethylbilane synthase
MRRQALVKRLRPDVQVVTFRGNVETRIAKLEAGAVDATLLALAGLKRLGLADAATAVLSVDEFLPAVGQGIVIMQTCEKREDVFELLSSVNDEGSFIAISAERGFLAALDGSCRSPIAGHATISDGQVRFRGMVLREDGSEVFECQRDGPVAEAAALGRDAGAELRGRAPPGLLTV